MIKAITPLLAGSLFLALAGPAVPAGGRVPAALKPAVTLPAAVVVRKAARVPADQKPAVTLPAAAGHPPNCHGPICKKANGERCFEEL